MRRILPILEVLLLMAMPHAADSMAITPDETRDAASWVSSAFPANPPFSFTYGGRPSAELLASWKAERSRRTLDGQRTEHTLTWTDPATGLVVRCVVVECHDFPTVEWTLYFKNGGAADTPILAEIQALDARFERAEGEFVLHHHTGSLCTATDYRPFATTLGPGADKRITTSGGRSSNSDLPYFNVEWPGGGVIVAIGWPGQWAARFARDAATGLRICAGQELTHFRLHPGEEVRAPLIALQFYRGDRGRAQNIWRRWMLAHNLPRPGGHLPPPTWTPCSSHQFGEMIGADEASQILFIARYLDEGLRPDYWWMDAGWYVNNGAWSNTGTWEVDAKRFPHGLRAISDHAHAKGVKIVVWFEPERVTAGTWLAEQHPEWLLSCKGGDNRLLDLGNPDARRWLVEHVDRLLTEQGIDLYRQDFNMDPLGCWRANDAENRQGITEIKHVEGYLAYWDELRRRHPGMLIDTCASGGRRNDLETLRRSVPFVRSDYLFEPTSQQCHTYGISFWIPYHGTGVMDGTSLRGSKIAGPFWLPKDGGRDLEPDAYLFRSAMSPHLTPCYDVRDKSLDYEAIRRLFAQWRDLADLYFGDYYPLTPYRTENDVWMAWQFDRPDLGRGVVQAFRRGDSAYETARFRLRGLDPDARYIVKDLDASDACEMRGDELMERGLSVRLPARPSAAVITYQRLEP